MHELPSRPSDSLFAIFFPVALGVCLLFGAAAPALAGTATQPEVTDDPGTEPGIPPELNLVSGWVGNETASAFSVFMKVESLAPPADAASFDQYHFHFQVTAPGDTESLFHAMVHEHAGGARTVMVQRWIPAGGQGAWGDTHAAEGVATVAAGLLEVRVEKAWIAPAKVDIARNGYALHSFFIHADRVNASTGALEITDSAPATGTMGTYFVSLGAPPRTATSDGAFGVPAALAAVAGVGALASRGARRRARGSR